MASSDGSSPVAWASRTIKRQSAPPKIEEASRMRRRSDRVGLLAMAPNIRMTPKRLDNARSTSGVRPAAVYTWASSASCISVAKEPVVNPAFRAISVNNSQWAGSSITPRGPAPMPIHPTRSSTSSSRANWPRTSELMERSPMVAHVPDPENKRPISP